MDSNGDGRIAINEALIGVANDLGGSLPETGPLAGGYVAYDGGYYTMVAFADGIESGTDMVRAAMENTMNDSVIATMEVYEAKSRELIAKSNMLADLAGSMVKAFGADGRIESSIDVSGEKEMVKKNIIEALSIPGLAGVSAAIVADGARTRMVLGRLLDESKAQTALMSTKGGSKIPRTGDANAG